MKLRFSSDSLRLRLSPSEVSGLALTGLVRSETAFSQSSVLVYELISSDDVLDPAVSCKSSTVQVRVPRRLVIAWAGSDKVGIYASQTIDENRRLKIVIEKDFECLDARGNEEGATFYPNPLKATS